MKYPARLLMLAASITLLFPCSISNSPEFQMRDIPEKVDQQFLAGHLGILSPELDKTYELVAYRYLKGIPTTAADLAAVGRLPAVPDYRSSVDNPAQEWRKLVARMLQRVQPGYFNGYKASRIAADTYYENCAPAAYDAALRTEANRERAYASRDLVVEWVRAQETVFSNCVNREAALPDEAPSGATALVRSDREYQIAAAYFYAEALDEAEKRFRALARDAGSPWHATARYMTARTLAREDSLLHKPGARDAAMEELRGVLVDPTAAEFYPSAKALLEHFTVLANPHPAMEQLARKLEAAPPDGIAPAIAEMKFMMQADSFRAAMKEPDVPEPFDWVRTLESKDYKHALERWRRDRSPAWLTLAVLYAQPNQTGEARELIAAADRTQPAYPGFDTITSSAIGLKIALGENASARNQLNGLLARQGPLVAVENAYRGQRMSLATSFTDFLQWASRRPVWSDSGEPEDKNPVLAEDAIQVLNTQTPQRMLEQAAANSALPAWIRNDVAEMAFTRSLLLADEAGTTRLAPIVTAAHPAWRVDMDAVVGTNGKARLAAAAMLVLRHSTIQPQLHVDYRKHLLNGDWWCLPVPEKPGAPVFREPGRVFTAEQMAVTAAEQKRLRATGSTQEFFGRAVLDLAKDHPDDPRLPEALYRLIRVTRYGCGGQPGTGPISKQAFDLLHRRYPSSDWTKKTPYWFGG